MRVICTSAFATFMGLLLGMSSTTSAPALVQVSGTDPFISPHCVGTVTRTDYLGDSIEPYVAAPQQQTDHADLLATVFQQDRWSDTGSRGIMAARSTDGGETWTAAPLPFSRCLPGGPDRDRASNPWVDIGPDGVIYASAVVFNASISPTGGTDSTDGVLAVTTSQDGGQTWDSPILLTGGVDKDSISTDPVHAGVAYVQANGGTGNKAGQLLWKTTDGGRTWGSPTVVVSATQPKGGVAQTLGSHILINPRTGMLFDVYQLNLIPRGGTISDTSYWTGISISANGDKTWKGERIVKQLLMGAQSSPSPIVVPPLRTSGGMPASAIDPRSGRLYAVWEDARFSKGRRADIVFSTSTTGTSWSAPRLVNPGDTKREFDPAIAVTSTGQVGVTYYSMVNRHNDDRPLTTRYLLQTSSDHGARFSKPRTLAGPFDMRDIPSVGGHFVGDEVGLATVGKQFVATFVLPGFDGGTKIVAAVVGRS